MKGNAMKAQWIVAALLCSTYAGAAVHAAEMRATMNAVSDAGVGKSTGTVTISETKYGLVFTPKLDGLPPGVHGFHVHENKSCDTNQKDGKPVPAGAAGGHLDTTGSKKHGLMVHAGGDNHADHPAPLGGGGARIVCGIIE